MFQAIETRVKAHFSTMIRVDKKLDYRLSEVEAVSSRFNSEAGERHSKSYNLDDVNTRLSKIEDLHKLMAWNTEREVILNESHRRT